MLLPRAFRITVLALLGTDDPFQFEAPHLDLYEKLIDRLATEGRIDDLHRCIHDVNHQRNAALRAMGHDE